MRDFHPTHHSQSRTFLLFFARWTTNSAKSLSLTPTWFSSSVHTLLTTESSCSLSMLAYLRLLDYYCVCKVREPFEGLPGHLPGVCEGGGFYNEMFQGLMDCVRAKEIFGGPETASSVLGALTPFFHSSQAFQNERNFKEFRVIH